MHNLKNVSGSVYSTVRVKVYIILMSFMFLWYFYHEPFF